MYIRGAKVRETFKKKRTDTGEKKSKKDKINHGLRKDYTTLKPLNAEFLETTLNKLSYGVIRHHSLLHICIDDERIDIDESWIGLIIFIIYSIMIDNPDDFMSIFLKNDVFNGEISMDTVYGKVSYDRAKQYSVYSVYDTGYYIEAVFDEECIYHTIIALMDCLKISCKSVVMCIKRKDGDLD